MSMQYEGIKDKPHQPNVQVFSTVDPRPVEPDFEVIEYTDDSHLNQMIHEATEREPLYQMDDITYNITEARCQRYNPHKDRWEYSYLEKINYKKLAELIRNDSLRDLTDSDIRWVWKNKTANWNRIPDSAYIHFARELFKKERE